MAKLPEIASLWIGGQLTWLEQLCLKSFADAGILKKMAQADLIEVQTKEIHIKDFDGLSELAESGRL